MLKSNGHDFGMSGNVTGRCGYAVSQVRMARTLPAALFGGSTDFLLAAARTDDLGAAGGLVAIARIIYLRAAGVGPHMIADAILALGSGRHLWPGLP